MFSWFKKTPFSAADQTRVALQPAAPAGRRLYAIGDIHGRFDLMSRLLKKIEEDLSGYEGDSRLIFLGDYIDRGHDSARVIDRLMQPFFTSLPPVFLRGNHEQCLLDLVTNEKIASGWLTFGGVNTLLSYKIPHVLGQTPLNIKALQDAIIIHFPPKHRQFIEAMGHVHEEGDYYFVHAGVHPERSLAEQTPRDWLWMREPFLSWSKPLEKVVVHGHTIFDEVEQHPHRIGIDTGAYASGKLTALVLEGTEQRLIQTGV